MSSRRTRSLGLGLAVGLVVITLLGVEEVERVWPFC